MQVLTTVTFGLVAACCTQLPAQSFRRAGVEFHAMRTVNVPSDKSYSVIVTQFFHHGQIAADGGNVVVSTRGRKLVPVRVLQVGPGDYCRLAFQTLQGQHAYEIFYGGEPAPKDALPAWKNRDGLLLETRAFKPCNLNRLESVRQAFETSTPIGADYVPGVFHSENPFALKPGPFLSHYSGYLNVDSAGTYGFMTSSQDCSFLLIDDKLVVDAPGQHRAIHRALPGSRKDVQLAVGAHKFDYYHAAVGPEAVMAVAWEVSPKGVKPEKPQQIPSGLFRSHAIGRAAAEGLTMGTARLSPDFVASLIGSVPLPDNETPLVSVQFAEACPKALTMKGKLMWDFGDGQVGEGAKIEHVFLRPGIYPVKLSVKHGGKPPEIVNRVYVEPPKVTDRSKLHKLDDYLPLLATYDPRTLDAVALRQLVLAYQAKADRYQPRSPDDPPVEPLPKRARRKEAEQALASSAETPEERAAARAEMLKYSTLATEAGKVAFLGDSPAKGDEDLMALARLLTPMARDVHGDAKLAYQIWQGAGQRIEEPRLRAECALEAADIAINDLVHAESAKRLLEAAARWTTGPATGPAAARALRIRGDYAALVGDGKSARNAYLEAEKAVLSSRRHVEQAAWRGARSRSTEQFLRTEEYDRAIAEIRAWQDEFPTEKIDGQLTLMYARYWAGRGMNDQAISLAEQLMTVAMDSPYIDQMLLLAGQCEVKRGKIDRAVATLQDLVKKYPGSPLLPTVKELISKLRAGEVQKPKTAPVRRPRAAPKEKKE